LCACSWNLCFRFCWFALYTTFDRLYMWVCIFRSCCGLGCYWSSLVSWVVVLC